jgi:hypothetical protein
MPLGVVGRIGASMEPAGELTKKLIDLSMRGLSQMLDVEGHFFCHRRLRSPEGAVSEEVVNRRTPATICPFSRRSSLSVMAVPKVSKPHQKDCAAHAPTAHAARAPRPNNHLAAVKKHL